MALFKVKRIHTFGANPRSQEVYASLKQRIMTKFQASPNALHKAVFSEANPLRTNRRALFVVMSFLWYYFLRKVLQDFFIWIIKRLEKTYFVICLWDYRTGMKMVPCCWFYMLCFSIFVHLYHFLDFFNCELHHVPLVGWKTGYKQNIEMSRD